MIAIGNKRITFSAFIFSLLLFWLCKLDCNSQNGWHYVPFEESMEKVGNCYEAFIRKRRKRCRYINYGMRNIEMFHFFRNLYKTNILPLSPRLQRTRRHDESNKKPGGIPKIIHQIWLGSELPERFKKLTETWKKHNPSWEYKLWTDEDAKKFNLSNRDLFEKSNRYDEKSDILRYEILYQHGGLYVDTDFECFKSFDILNENFQFYCGVEPLLAHQVMLGNALIASIPGHPILKHCIEQMKDNVEHMESVMTGGRTCKFFKKCFVCFKTGPYYLTKILIETVKGLNKEEREKVITFPASYFYPIFFNDPTVQAFDESFGVHLWDASLKK